MVEKEAVAKVGGRGWAQVGKWLEVAGGKGHSSCCHLLLHAWQVDGRLLQRA